MMTISLPGFKIHTLLLEQEGIYSIEFKTCIDD